MCPNYTFWLLSVQVKYKEAFEMVKAKAYTLHPEGVNFVTSRKAHKIINDVSEEVPSVVVLNTRGGP